MTGIQLPEALVPSGGFRDVWGSQAAQYPRTGPPGISYWLGRTNIGDIAGTDNRPMGRVWYDVDHLLYRSRKGVLVGILQYFPVDAPMGLEEAGNFNVFTHPRRQHRGIATKLLAAADYRWGPLKWEQQRYTPEGLALTQRYLDTVYG